MSVAINSAHIAAQAYIRPTQQPVRTGFSVGQEAPVNRTREALVTERRTAPAVQVTLSPEALDLLAKSRVESPENRERHANSAAQDNSRDTLSDEPAHAYVRAETHDQRVYQRPGSQLDITL